MGQQTADDVTKVADPKQKAPQHLNKLDCLPGDASIVLSYWRIQLNAYPNTRFEFNRPSEAKVSRESHAVD
jgi:hypothetical protein